VIYLTLPGWCLLLARGIDALGSWIAQALSTGETSSPAASVFATVALLLIPIHAARREQGRWWVAEAHRSVREVLDPLRSQALPHAAKVLFLADPFPKDDYILTFIFRVRFQDDEFRVDRAKLLPAALPAAYDRVYRLEQGRLTAQ
jgi:hypothetical protein